MCSICSSIAKEKFNIKDRKPGVNFPPLHPWCRCTFEIVVDDWNKWMDDYVKRHKSSGEYLKDIFQSGTISSNKTIISKDVLKNIKSFDLPEFTARENEELRKAMVKLLERVDGTAQNTECASFYDIHMRFLKWEIGKSGQGSVKMYSPPFDYIALHNHPSGGTFAINDLDKFVENANLKVMIVVGNNGNQYLMKKTNNFNGKALINDYTNYLTKMNNNCKTVSEFLTEANKFLLNEGAKYGVDYKSIK